MRKKSKKEYAAPWMEPVWTDGGIQLLAESDVNTVSDLDDYEPGGEGIVFTEE